MRPGRYLCITIACFILAKGESAHAAIHYVKASATGANNGSNWTDAHSGPFGLQQAIGAAQSGDQMWVAFGTYTPSTPGGNNATFLVGANVVFYGGFRGLSGDEELNTATTRPPDPDPMTANPATDSILSGVLGGDNCYHVVTAAGDGGFITGFTITGGVADLDNDPGNRGAGMLVSGFSVDVGNCAFLANTSLRYGGAVYCQNGGLNIGQCTFIGNSGPQQGGAISSVSSSVYLTDCTFVSNSAVDGGAEGLGGAVRMSGGSLHLLRCTFSGNSARRGGALYLELPSADIEFCTFENNAAHNGGGAVRLNGAGQFQFEGCKFVANQAASNGLHGGAIESTNSAHLIAQNCRFWGNTAQGEGGAIRSTTSSNADIVQCIFSGNRTIGNLGAALCVRGATCNVVNSTFSGNYENGGTIALRDSASLFLRNSIVWGNNAGAISSVAGTSATVTFSDIQGGFAGNLSVDPLFLDADGANNIVGDIDDNLRLAIPSPCIDAGRNSDIALNADLDGAPRLFNVPSVPDTGDGSSPIVDMGAYEVQDCNANAINDTAEADSDSDGVIDDCDNCPNASNSNQTDVDGDGTGDACDGCRLDPNKISPGICGCGVPDTDGDGDGLIYCMDNCPNIANPGQEDADGDGAGDACDNCAAFNPSQADTNSNGIGDTCEWQCLNTGDMNCNGVTNSDDLPAFVNVMVTGDDATLVEIADLSGDHLADGRDIGLFVDCLLGGPCGSATDGLPTLEHRVFTTSTRSNGNLGGIAGADAICQACAENAGLTREYMAIISDSTSAIRDRLSVTGPIRLWTGDHFEFVAGSHADLFDGSIARPLSFDESGATISSTFSIHTGSLADGTIGLSFCNTWITGVGNETTGSCNQSNGAWIESSQLSCSSVKRIYCISKPIIYSDGLPANEHRIFTTSTTSNGNLGGIAGADAICEACAENAGLTRRYVAIISDSTSAIRDRLTINGPIRIWNGTAFEYVAGSHADLFDGSIARPLDRDEFGEAISVTTVHTGSNPDGTMSGFQCSSWTNSSGTGVPGQTNQTNSAWISGSNSSCFTQRCLYCISQP